MSSQQQPQQPAGARTSSALGSKQPLRSDSTRPVSSRTSGVAGSLGRQASFSSLPGASAPAAAAAATTRPGSGRASLGAGRTAPAGGTTAAPAAGIAAARSLGKQSAAAATDGPAMQSNALFYEQASGGGGGLSGAAARRRDSDADLLLQQQQASAAAASLLAGAGGSAAVAAAAAAARPAAAVSARLAAAPPPPKPQHFLRTTGDLFVMPDQDAALKEPVRLAVGGTQLVSPAWNQARVWLSGSWVMQRPQEFIQEAGGCAEIPALADLSRVPPEAADSMLVDDLLTVFMGQAGQYVKAVPVEDDGSIWQRIGLYVQGVPDCSLQEQVERLLPLCEHVLVVKRFVETRSRIDYPLVTQALAAAMRKLQEEWWLLVVQLEHQLMLGSLTLAGLVYYCQAPAASMALLASIAGEAASSARMTSAGLLNLLHARQGSLAGDRAGQQLVGQLLQAASEPYFAILRQWLCLGVLDDPHGEFVVKEEAGVARDSVTVRKEAAYWTQRFRLKVAVEGEGGELDAPCFLRPHINDILVTGKYLNVIRLCGQPVPPCPDSTLEQLRYDAAAAEGGSPPYIAGIQAALSAAAGALLAHTMGPQGRLLSWLHCLKHLYLLDQGDFLVHLMEAGDAKSATPLKQLAPHQLQGLLEAALRSSSVAASPHIDVVGEGALSMRWGKASAAQLMISIADIENGQATQSQLHVAPPEHRSWLDLVLSLHLAWPLNLVVSELQLLRYQAIFKQLLSLKYAERQLGRVWQALRATKRLDKKEQPHFKPWTLLCSQLQHVVVEVLRYTSIDVLEPLWWHMFTRVRQTANLDEVLELHNQFLRDALERALMRQPSVLRHIEALLSVAADLSDTVQAALDSGKEQHTARGYLTRLAAFGREANSEAQVQQMQQRADAALAALLKLLDALYRDSQQSREGACGALGDSSRELSNLIERLRRKGGAVVSY